MSTRPTWKGVLRISLVQIPIKVYPATEASAGLSFNQLHETCQNRVTQRRWCTNCAREVSSAEIAKGFEFEKGRYVILDDAELDAVKPESTRVIDLVQFADVAALDPLSIDRSYYLAPDGEPAAEAFLVFSTAMAGHVGIGKMAMYGREYLVAVRPPRARASEVAPLVLHTLHHAAEMRSTPTWEGPSFSSVPTEQVKLARQVLTAFHRPLDLAAFTDEYQRDIQRLIDAKIAGEEIVMPQIEPTPAAASLREALTLSLAAVSAAKKTPVKVSAPKKKRAS